MISVIQINLNKSGLALDNLKQKINEMKTDVAIIAEPPVIKTAGLWITSVDNQAAIYFTGGQRTLKTLKQEEGLVICRVGETIIISVYFSPNRKIQEFEAY
ncbi:hypothetical protein ANTQUA_LOCUS5883 [Anthophora quadrimaculata]